MKRDDALAFLRAREADLKRFGVPSLYVFGSTAREEATEESDVDSFFDHERESWAVPVDGFEGIRERYIGR